MKSEPKVEPKFDPKVDSDPASSPGKKLYDNLEEEMASLLGRPSDKDVTARSDRRVRLLTVAAGVAGLIVAGDAGSPRRISASISDKAAAAA